MRINVAAFGRKPVISAAIAVVILLFTPWTTLAEVTNSPASTNDDVRLRVTLLDSVMLHEFSGSVTPAGRVDLRYAVTVRYESSIPAITNLKSGAVVTFAVHSPSLFLRDTPEKGKTNEIVLPRKTAINLFAK